MIVIGKYKVEEVLPFVVESYRKERKQYGEYFVKISSQRLLLFKTSCQCVSCSRLGTYFLLEKDTEVDTPHFNLYTDDGILMTKDHILPKSKGGVNRMINYQTMCSECNCRKGNKIDNKKSTF